MTCLLAQEHGKELEQRLAQNAAELELARQTATALERRLVGAKTKGEVDEMTRRLHEAEKAAADVQRNHADLVFKAEVRRRRLQEAVYRGCALLVLLCTVVYQFNHG